MKTLLAMMFVIALTGCQAPGQAPVFEKNWTVLVTKDEFTDEVTKLVTVGEGLSDKFFITKPFRYYPFVGTIDGELYVGIRSGGFYKIPTGTVQIRVDDNEAWTIGPEETSIQLVPLLPSPSEVSVDATTIDVGKLQADMMENMSKIMSPFTATTGDKAKAIIKEMLNGKKIKYRTVGLNQAASTVGETIINSSFASSLREIGIDPDNL